MITYKSNYDMSNLITTIRQYSVIWKKTSNVGGTKEIVIRRQLNLGIKSNDSQLQLPFILSFQATRDWQGPH